MIIGITGTPGAGKGEAVKYLVTKKGFRHISARAIWTKELEKTNTPVNRDTMTVLANALRAENGPAYFMETALAEVTGPNDNVVIESVRTVAEAELLKNEGGVLLSVDADQKERYKRIKNRKSSLDNVSFADFKRQEETEMDNDDPNKQNIGRVMTMSDFVIENNGTLEELHKQTEKVLKQLEI